MIWQDRWLVMTTFHYSAQHWEASWVAHHWHANHVKINPAYQLAYNVVTPVYRIHQYLNLLINN